MGFQGVFSTADTMLFHRNTVKTGNNQPSKYPRHSTPFARYKRFTDLNLFKYAFNVIQNWETVGAYMYFLLAVMVEGDKSSRLRRAN